MKDCERMAQLNADEQYFVISIGKSSNFQLVRGSSPLRLDIFGESLQLAYEKQVYLFDGKSKKVKTAFRLIKVILLKSKEKVLLLSNLPVYESSVQQIAGLYQKRWQIECFFCFIQQELNFKFYFSRHSRGIQVMSYIILIASI